MAIFFEKNTLYRKGIKFKDTLFMSNSFTPWNPLDPMNHSCYTEFEYPGTIEEVVKYYDSVPTVKPNGPKLAPQPTKDSWYYSKDDADDGHISPFEKLKAFVKGGTYNMVRGLFCDKDGFSWGRTLTSAAVGTAIALTGPIGLAVAGGFGLLGAADNFAHSVKRAKNAVTDQEAREAYEGVGESASTAGLSLWGGFKGLKAIKNNFSFARSNPDANISLWTKLSQWDIRRTFTRRIIQNRPPVDEPVQPKPPVETGEIKFPVREGEVAGAGSPIALEGDYFPETTPTQVYPHTGPNAVKPADSYFAESTPIGDIPKTPPAKPQVAQPDYFAESTPTGYKPDTNPAPIQQNQYFSESSPVGDIPKGVNNIPQDAYFSEGTPMG